jgi:hypothetical protein
MRAVTARPMSLRADAVLSAEARATPVPVMLVVSAWFVVPGQEAATERKGGRGGKVGDGFVVRGFGVAPFPRGSGVAPV